MARDTTLKKKMTEKKKLHYKVMISKRKMSVHDFYGKHLIASYKECDPTSLNNPYFVKQLMTKAIETTGATILNCSDFVFTVEDNSSIQGYTAVFLLSESHASIHTYPEYHSAFVDLFTCGTTCTWENFHKSMKNGLSSKLDEFQILSRS